MTDRDLPGWRRIIREFYESWKIIRRDKPSICFTMNPSIFSSWWLSLLAAVNRFRLITDLHTPNIKLSGFKNKIFRIIFNSGIRRSDIVIVSNEIYRRSVLSFNSNVVVIPDPLPVLQGSNEGAGNRYRYEDKKIQVLFVCSFDPDEPVNEVLALDPEIGDFDILVSGNWKKMFTSVPNVKNLRFLGFIPADEYDQLLLSVDGIMVLTAEEGCLCCGAYEAFSAGKPLILSRTGALQDFFGSAPIYTENTSDAILSALQKLKSEKDQRAKMVVMDRAILQNKFEKGVNNLEIILTGLSGDSKEGTIDKDH
jgi:glycosyltransferase involved in cell wall biosynthesis